LLTAFNLLIDDILSATLLKNDSYDIYSSNPKMGRRKNTKRNIFKRRLRKMIQRLKKRQGAKKKKKTFKKSILHRLRR